MPIIVRLDRMLADRNMTLKELSNRVSLSYVNMSRIKTGKAKAIRLATLELVCEALDCQVEDILEYEPEAPE